MIFRETPRQSERDRTMRLAEWHPHFPLLPIVINGVGSVWLQWVERRGHPYITGEGIRSWEYRLPPTGYAPVTA